MPEAERHQHWPADGAGAGPAGEHDPVEHQHAIALPQRPGMEGGNHRIELLGHRADRGRTDRPAEHRQQRLRDLAHRQTKDKAGQDHAVDLLGTARISAQHADRREAAGARYRQLDVAQLGQQMSPIAAIAPVGPVERSHPIKVLVDRLPHLRLEDRSNRIPAQSPIALAPFQPLCLHSLHQLEGPR